MEENIYLMSWFYHWQLVVLTSLEQWLWRKTPGASFEQMANAPSNDVSERLGNKWRLVWKWPHAHMGRPAFCSASPWSLLAQPHCKVFQQELGGAGLNMHYSKKKQCHLSQETRCLGNNKQLLWVLCFPPVIWAFLFLEWIKIIKLIKY